MINSKMLSQLTNLFKSSKETPEQLFLKENDLVFDSRGAIYRGIVLNELGFRLEYFSNRKLDRFDDLEKLFRIAPQINEKIDLELHSQRFVERLGNTEENLKELKQIIKVLNDYYVKFQRPR
jgi:redox-regulated HSP33 family molecular chaperone